MPPLRLRQQVAEEAPSASRVHVVAPILVGPIDWLATAEDDAHREAEVRALEAEWTLADAAEVEGEAGEADPVQAVEDALRLFPADEILVCGERVDPDLHAELARFGLRVRELAPAGPRRSGGYRFLRSLAGGRRPATPFVLFVGVNGALLLLAVLLSLVVLSILWLTGAI